MSAANHHAGGEVNTQLEDQVLLVLTLIIGAVVGLVVVAFIYLTENLGSRLYPAGAPAWRRVFIPLAGALGTGFLLARYFPNARGSGIPQTKTALFLRDGYIRFRTVLGKFSLCSVSLASGISLGREGPSVQVGAGIASVLGRKLGLSPASVKALVPAGASAALAAAFNTPISAVLFTLEEVMGDMHAPVLGSIVLSSATSWIVLHLLLGDEPLFHVPAYQLVHPVEFVFYAALGVAGGLVSVAFVKLLLWQRRHFLRLPASTQWIHPAVGGLTVGLLGWFVPDVLGVGYQFVSQALNGQMLLGTMALLVVLKVVATATAYGSGNAGGIFGPALFMGAMTGGAVGGVAHMLFPDYTGSAGAYALVGMGATFAGVVRVPLTSVIMIFEITRDYSIIVPLMISNLISYFISSRLQEEPVYEALLHQDGIHLPTGARAREALLMVAHAYRPETQVFAAAQRIGEVASSIQGGQGAWPVVDVGGLRGMVTAQQLEEAVLANRGEETLGDLVPAPGPIETLTEANFPHVHPSHPLDVAMRRIAETGWNVLPVVSRTNVRDLKGTISLQDILASYRIGRTGDQPAAAGAVSTRFPARLLAGALTALISVALLTGFFNYFYRAERSRRAVHYYQAGNELVQMQRYDEAVEQYRNALSISHDMNTRLALGLALVKAGRLNEAAIYLNEVLRDRSGNGPANLGVAQIYAQQGQIGDAVLHYRRAMYGSWPDHPQENRFRASLELAQVLEKAGRHSQAQAQLLSEAASIPNDPALKKQLGSALIEYGLPRNAVNLFRSILQQDKKDISAYGGLGNAEFALGDYVSAREAFRSALKLDPADTVAGKRIDVCDRILELDPTLRGLSATERFRRSRQVLAGVLKELLVCTGGESELPAPLYDMVKSAQAALAFRKRPSSYSDAEASNISLAEQLWSQRSESCQGQAAPDDALTRVMAQLSSH